MHVNLSPAIINWSSVVDLLRQFEIGTWERMHMKDEMAVYEDY